MLIFMLCNDSFKCKYKDIELILSITKSTQFIFHSLYLNMYFGLTRRVEMLQKTNLIAFISLFDLRTFYQHSTFVY